MTGAEYSKRDSSVENNSPIILNIFYLGFKDFGTCLAKDIKVVKKDIGLIQEAYCPIVVVRVTPSRARESFMSMLMKLS